MTIYPTIYRPNENITLYRGDCLDILPTLTGVDCVVTDPPFNAGKDFDNDDMPDWEWRDYCLLFANAIRCIGPENVIVEVGKNDRWMRSALDVKFRYRWAIALNYTNSMRQGAVGFSNFGLVLWYGEKCYSRYMDRIDSPLISSLNDFSHPSPKQVKHYHRLVEMFSSDGALVLDPFMGSGTTGVACIRTGRRFIGIEIDPTHYATACKRIDNELQRMTLPMEVQG